MKARSRKVGKWRNKLTIIFSPWFAVKWMPNDAMLKKLFVWISLLILLINLDSSLGFPPAKALPSQVEKTQFGQTADGEVVDLYTLKNREGLIAKITNYGAILTEFYVPDRNGKLEDVVLGFDRLEDYFVANQYLYFGSIVGRVANRIEKAQFSLNDQLYDLAANAFPHHIHGGNQGFDKVVWEAEPMETVEGVGLKLSYLSRDREEGYPGNVAVTVLYTLTNENELKLEMEAQTDQPTPINLINHSYWNLAGHNSSHQILDQFLMINADQYTPTDQEGIPTGELKSVQNTPYDFTKSQLLREGIKQQGGYDLNYVLNRKTETIELAATVFDLNSGRVMELYTNQPGLQFFSGNIGTLKTLGKGGFTYRSHQGLCLETQQFPNAVNQPNFPSVIFNPNETYRHVMVYKFSTR